MRLPTERGGWWHAYVCPAHGVELEHVGLLDGSFPAGGAPCRYGCRIDTPEVRGAWAVLAHQACARSLTSVPLLQEYAALYASLGEHDGAQPWMLRGRLFQQALTEAIWAVSIGSAAWALIDAGEDVGSSVLELLDELASAAYSARASLVAEGKFRSNYTAWLNAAGAVCSRKPEWLDGEHGIYAHVLAATGEDGWEWEGSTYYHQFVLRAYRLGIGTADVPTRMADRLAAMASVLSTVTTPGGVVPALHDGPYARPDYDRELASLRPLPPADSAAVTVYQDVGYAVLRGNGIHAIVDFGPHGGSHGHRDKLALYLYGDTAAWQPDPGQVPYGHTPLRDYYASTAAHPTFSVDGGEQAPCAGRLIRADEDGVVVGCDDAYPGVSARRHIALRDGGLVDELTVAADRTCQVTAHLRPGVDLSVLARGETNWAGTLHGRHECSAPADFLCRPGYGTADDPQVSRTHVDWVARDVTTVTFRSAYRPCEG